MKTQRFTNSNKQIKNIKIQNEHVAPSSKVKSIHFIKYHRLQSICMGELFSNELFYCVYHTQRYHLGWKAIQLINSNFKLRQSRLGKAGLALLGPELTEYYWCGPFHSLKFNTYFKQVRNCLGRGCKQQGPSDIKRQIFKI